MRKTAMHNGLEMQQVTNAAGKNIIDNDNLMGGGRKTKGTNFNLFDKWKQVNKGAKDLENYINGDNMFNVSRKTLGGGQNEAQMDLNFGDDEGSEDELMDDKNKGNEDNGKNYENTGVIIADEVIITVAKAHKSQEEKERQ